MVGLHDYYVTSIRTENEFKFIMSYFFESISEVDRLWVGLYSEDPSSGKENEAWSWADGSPVDKSSWDNWFPWKPFCPRDTVNISNNAF